MKALFIVLIVLNIAACSSMQIKPTATVSVGTSL